jgi:hypothetical protein
VGRIVWPPAFLFRETLTAGITNGNGVYFGLTAFGFCLSSAAAAARLSSHRKYIPIDD